MHTQSGTTSGKLLPIAIPVLALADGILHLALDFVLFRGNVFGNQLSVLFLLNFIGYAVLAAAFTFWPRSLADRRWLIDAAIIVFALVTLVMWLMRNGPNPMGYLGYLSKSIEVLLIVAAATHLATTRGAQTAQQRA